ncbi:hypothetical protein GCM10010124_36230 [Pilimelia terevasa]|uniref:Pyrrolo-quinoline quinone repeat domain-containing protein n=1 Tax=Pilimelia terevasa TaxID=53372 RepID=A0A8J3BPW2_9ACTN|nr:PQQ-binding-like beta-propeller repeat protein [Pilimelia terevasa]GGK40260.1 hypothetical protein GCM10010124_36230 [Pilimelia terevasa]
MAGSAPMGRRAALRCGAAGALALALGTPAPAAGAPATGRRRARPDPVRWSSPLPDGPVECGVALGHGAVYAVTGSQLTAVEVASGAPRWRADLPAVRRSYATLLTARDHVVAGVADWITPSQVRYQTAARRPGDGAPGWESTSFCPRAVHGDALVAEFRPTRSRRDVGGFAAATGALRWRLARTGIGETDVTDGQPDRLVAHAPLAGEGSWVLLDALTGDVRWRRPLRGVAAATADTGDGLIVMVQNESRFLQRINAAAGTPDWVVSVPDAWALRLSATDAVVATAAGAVTAHDLRTGAPRWTWTPPATVRQPRLRVSGARVYLDGGDVGWLLDAATGALIGPPVVDLGWPAMDDSTLYGVNAGRLVALALP